MSVSVCLSVHDHIFGTARPIFTKIVVPVTYGRGSVLWRRKSPKWPILCRVGRWILLHPSIPVCTMRGSIKIVGRLFCGREDGFCTCIRNKQLCCRRLCIYTRPIPSHLCRSARLSVLPLRVQQLLLLTPSLPSYPNHMATASRAPRGYGKWARAAVLTFSVTKMKTRMAAAVIFVFVRRQFRCCILLWGELILRNVNVLPSHDVKVALIQIWSLTFSAKFSVSHDMPIWWKIYIFRFAEAWLKYHVCICYFWVGNVFAYFVSVVLPILNVLLSVACHGKTECSCASLQSKLSASDIGWLYIYISTDCPHPDIRGRLTDWEFCTWTFKIQ